MFGGSQQNARFRSKRMKQLLWEAVLIPKAPVCPVLYVVVMAEQRYHAAASFRRIVSDPFKMCTCLIP